MAANDPDLFSKIVLVAPVGIRPPEGDIMDLFTVPALVYLRESVRDAAHTAEYAALYDGGVSEAQYEAFEDARAETARLAWQPYMFNPSLPHLLEGTVKAPTLIVWGREDRVAPFSAAAVFKKSIAGRSCSRSTDADIGRKSKNRNSSSKKFRTFSRKGTDAYAYNVVH